MNPLFDGKFFYFCAALANSKTPTPNRGVPHLDAVVRHGGGLLSSLPVTRPRTVTSSSEDSVLDEAGASVIAVGTPSECYQVRDQLRRRGVGNVTSRVIFVRPAYIEDCVAAQRALPLEPYTVFRGAERSDLAPTSSNAVRGPAANQDFESLELAVAIEMHRVAREIQMEIAWRKQSSPRARCAASRSPSAASIPEGHWFGDVDAKLASVISQGNAVVQDYLASD